MQDYKYILGLDIGIASIGWAVIDKEENKIIKSGVRCFNKAENPKTGESLSLPRRLKRGVRRIIRRRHQRLRSIFRLLKSEGLNFEKKDLIKLDPWDLRVNALKRKLKEEEFACILFHIAKRRGFKSAKKIKKVDSETAGEAKQSVDEKSKMLFGTYSLEIELRNSPYETIGEYLANCDKKRNEPESYTRTILRKLLEEEVGKIFDFQREIGCQFAKQELCEKYCKIAFTQKPMQSTLKMVGKCEFEKNEKRAPKASLTFEKFRNLQTLINNVKITKKPRLSAEEINEIIKLALNSKTGKATYAQIRKLLGLSEEQRFINLSYGKKEGEEKQKDPEKEAAIEFKAYAKLRKAIESVDSDCWDKIKNNIGLYDKIAWILTVEKDEFVIQKELTKIIKDKSEKYEDIVDNLLDCTFDKHGNLSLKAMRKIIPYMEQGLTYDKACAEAGYQHSQTTVGAGNEKFISKFEDLRNPVVNRALSQTRKVVNALIRKYGSFSDIYIELAREMGKTFRERQDIKKRNDQSFELAEDRKRNFMELVKREPAPGEILKYRLWKEQGNRCPYCSQSIEAERFWDDTYTQVDHIIPYSRSFDDSLKNKVLVHSKCNQEKGNKTPYEWLGHDEEMWNKLLAETSNYDYIKKRNLYIGQNGNERELEEKLDDWKNRNINDTRYITREVMNKFRSSLKFLEQDKQHVFCRNGQVTDLLKKFWGLSKLKNREENDRHHALDAIVVAMCSNIMNQKLSSFFTHHEEAANILEHSHLGRIFPLPWDGFREDVKKSLDEIFVSRMPMRKVTGEAHEETIRSQRTLNDGSKIIVQRKRIKDVTKSDVENLFDKERNGNLYNTLMTRINEFTGKEKDLFKEPIYMPTKDGGRGPQIKSITIKTNNQSGLLLDKNEGASKRAIASNGRMVRVDIFEKDDKFYCVPIYVADMIKNGLPNMACMANKDENEWILVDDSFLFKFSLYQYDYIKLVNSKGEVIEGYFVSFNRRTASIQEIISQDNSKSYISVGVKTLKSFEKYHIDVLGNKFKVKKEIRNGLEKRNNNKSCKSKAKRQAISNCQG